MNYHYEVSYDKKKLQADGLCIVLVAWSACIAKVYTLTRQQKHLEFIVVVINLSLIISLISAVVKTKVFACDLKQNPLWQTYMYIHSLHCSTPGFPTLTAKVEANVFLELRGWQMNYRIMLLWWHACGSLLRRGLLLKGGWENGKRERKQYDRRAFYFLIVAFFGIPSRSLCWGESACWISIRSLIVGFCFFLFI